MCSPVQLQLLLLMERVNEARSIIVSAFFDFCFVAHLNVMVTVMTTTAAVAVAVIPGFRSIREVVSFTSKQARIVHSCLNLIILYMSGDQPFSHSTVLVLFFVFFSFRFSYRK
jgi:hypothetical protein